MMQLPPAHKIARAIVRLALPALLPVHASGAFYVVVVEGLGGEQRYAESFREQVSAIETAAMTLTEASRVTVFRSEAAGREQILSHLDSLASVLAPADQIALYLIGHGSYDEYEYKFNIAGPDLTDSDLKTVFDALPSRQQIVINTSSASGALADELADDERVILTATRSGAERHATHFGTWFTQALADPGADTDKNRLISAREAFDFANRQVSDYFAQSGILATEHARLEGGAAERFNLARLGRASTDNADALLDELTVNRDAVSARIDELRLARDTMHSADYQRRLQEQLLELALIEEAIEEREAALGHDR